LDDQSHVDFPKEESEKKSHLIKLNFSTVQTQNMAPYF